jgi:single-strand DNA-binding protein
MYNKVFLIGNLVRDPDLRYTPSGIPVARFTVAVNHIRRKGEGEDKNEVDFINVVAWRRLAEICGEFLKKGRPVAIEGRLQIRDFEKAGEKRTMVEVVADNMQMLGRKPDLAAASSETAAENIGAENIEKESDESGEKEAETPF